jgi:hypothetical protein
VQILAKVLMCEDQHGNRSPMFITALWTVPQAKENAVRIGLRPLYCINVRSK